VTTITGVEVEVETGGSAVGCGDSAKSGGAAEEVVSSLASGVARVLAGFGEFDGLDVSEGRLLIQ